MMGAMRGTFRALGRLPILAQFLLVPLPLTLGALAYRSWGWAHADFGVLEARKAHGYHALGWTVLPLTMVAAALFAGTIARGVKERPGGSRTLLAATCLVLMAILLTVLWGSADLSACACDGG